MKPKKTHTAEKKVLLYELQQITKALYPTIKTVNPYQEQIQDYLKELPIKEQLLYNEIVHSLTLLNKQSRINEHQKIITSKTDILNAMQLLDLEQLPKQNQSLEAHEKLYKKYRNKPFIKLDAQVYLRKSKTTIRRYFIDLKQLELLEKTNQKKQFRDLYQVKKKPIIYQEKETKSIFEQAHQEWEDYQGWTDLTHRT